jgi:signal transduction histidine kinase
MRGIRARLTLTIVALVALTAAILGIGSYLVVDNRLHNQALDDARNQATFDLSVLIPSLGLPAGPTSDDIIKSGVLGTLARRGVDLIVAHDDEVLAASPAGLTAALAAIPSPLRSLVSGGQLGYAWTTLGGRPVLVVGGRLPPSGPDFYFVHDASAIEQTLDLLRLGIGVVALILIAIALLVARVVARGVLAPVVAAGRAAERIELGDLSARVPVTSRDEFGAWAERFNRMAEALGDTIGQLRAAQTQNRRFVADVSHELRTPLAALVAEASILRESLGSLPDESRRAGELLVSDVARLRTLVDELMELSRFDADAEQIAPEPVDLARLVAAVVARRSPEADVDLPAGPVTIETDPRRLERILGNLLDNAREHAPGTPVVVTLAGTPAARDGDGAIEISVADGGPGVERDRLDRIFDRFYKADPSRHGGSSGLGLAIAGEHAALLGGALRAENRPEGGLRITLRLPVTGSLRRGDSFAIRTDDRGAPTPPPQEPPR